MIADIVKELRMKKVKDPVGRNGRVDGQWMIDAVGMVDG